MVTHEDHVSNETKVPSIWESTTVMNAYAQRECSPYGAKPNQVRLHYESRNCPIGTLVFGFTPASLAFMLAYHLCLWT